MPTMQAHSLCLILLMLGAIESITGTNSVWHLETRPSLKYTSSGGSPTITCYNISNTISATPYNPQWYKIASNGTLQQISTDRSERVRSDGSQLRISSAESEDNGTYCCKGPQQTLDTCDESATAILIVVVSPVIVPEQNQTVLTKSNVTMVCLIQNVGQPPFTVFRWEKSGQRLVTDGTKYISWLNGNRMFLTIINSTTDDEGYYQCILETPVFQRRQASVHLTVNHTGTTHTGLTNVATVAFKQAIYNAIENTNTQIVLILSNPSSNEVTTEVPTSSITAFGGVDYAPGPYSISFFPNQTLAPLTIAIINDYVLEDNEMFHLTISASSLPNNVNVGKPDQATMIIEDDDVATVRFGNKTYCATKNNGIVQPALILSIPSSTNITLVVTAHGDVGHAHGIKKLYNVTFPANHKRVQFDVIISDSILEADKIFLLNIDSSSLPSNVIVGDPDKIKVIIEDKDCNNNNSNSAEIGGLIGGRVVAIIILITTFIIFDD